MFCFVENNEKLPKYGLLFNVLQTINFEPATKGQLERLCSHNVDKVIRNASNHNLLVAQNNRFYITNDGTKKLVELAKRFDKEVI